VGEDDGPRISDPLVELDIRLDDWVSGLVDTHPDLTDGSVGLYRQLCLAVKGVRELTSKSGAVSPSRSAILIIYCLIQVESDSKNDMEE